MLTHCKDCIYCHDRASTASKLSAERYRTEPRFALYRHECRARAPVAAVESDGNEIYPWPTVLIDSGFCGEGQAKEPANATP